MPVVLFAVGLCFISFVLMVIKGSWVFVFLTFKQIFLKAFFFSFLRETFTGKAAISLFLHHALRFKWSKFLLLDVVSGSLVF